MPRSGLYVAEVYLHGGRTVTCGTVPVYSFFSFATASKLKKLYTGTEIQDSVNITASVAGEKA
jgi:hypothetical protein